MKILVGLVLLITAGSQLEASHPFLKPGTEYRYDFYMHSLATLPENGNRQTGTSFKGKLVIEVPRDQDLARFRIDEIRTARYNGDLRTVDEDIIPWNYGPVLPEWENHLKYYFEVKFDSEKRTATIEVIQEMEEEIINFQRAIVTAFILDERVKPQIIIIPPPPKTNYHEDTDVFKVLEDGIRGINEALYVVESLPSAYNVSASVKNVTKYLDFFTTENIPYWNRSTHIPIQCADCDAYSNQHLLTTTVKTEYDIDFEFDVIENISSYGLTKQAPLGDDADYFLVNETVLFEIVSTRPLSMKPPDRALSSTKVVPLPFRFPTASRALPDDNLKKPLVPFLISTKRDIEKGKKICKDMVIRIIRELNGKTLYADTPVLFLSCVKHIRKLTSEEISTVYKEVCDSFPISFYESDCRSMMVDVLMASRSSPAYVFVLKLVANKEINETKSIRAVELLQPFEPTHELIDEVFRVTKTSLPWPVKKALLLAAAGLVRKACDGPHDDIPSLPGRPYANIYCPDEYERKWIAVFENLLRTADTKNKTLVLLTALGETMLPTAIDPIERYLEDEDDMIVVTALKQLRKIAKFSPSDVRPIVEKVLYNLTNSPAVRITALKALVASGSDFSDIEKILGSLTQDINDDVGGYFSRFIRELANTTHYCMQDLANNCKQLLEFVDEDDENGAIFGSNLWEYSTMLDDTSFSTQSLLSILKSNSSVWPEVFSYKVNSSFSGYSYIPFGAHVHVQGLQGLFNEYLGPPADYDEDSDRTDEFNEKLKIQNRTDDPFYLHGVFKFGDSSIKVIDINRTTLEELFKSGEWKDGKRIHKHMLSIPYEIKAQIPSIVGIPLQFVVISAKIFSIDAIVKFNVTLGKLTGSRSPIIVDFGYKGNVSYTAYTKLTAGTFNPFDMYISNVGVNSSFHFAPKLAINYNVSLFNGNSSLKIRPLSELLPDEHRPKMLGYGVLPFSNQRKIADIGDMSSFKRIHTRPLQVYEKVDLTNKLLPLPLIYERKSELKHNDYGPFDTNYLYQHNIFSFLHSWWVTPNFEARSYQLYFKPVEKPSLEFRGNWTYIPSPIERHILSANESSQGLWTILTGYASVPPRCSPIERKSVQSPPYATAGKKPFFAYSDTEKFKIKRQYSSGAEDSLIFTNIPTDREVSRLILKLKTISKFSSTTAEIGSKLTLSRYLPNNTVAIEKILTVNTPKSKDQYCARGFIQYPLIPCDYYKAIPKLLPPPFVSGKVKVVYGMPNCENGQEIISGTITLSKTKEQEKMESERKEWYYEQCKEDRSNKIFYSYACRYAVMKLSTYKKMILDISYKNLPDRLKIREYRLDTFLKAKYYTQMSTNPVNVDNTPGKLVIETHLYDKVPGVYDLWLYEEKENTSFHKVYLGDSLALLPPPSIKHRMLDRLIKNITNEVVAASCTVTGGYIFTFDNTSYDYNISFCPHVLVKDCSPYDLFAITQAWGVGPGGPTKIVEVYVLNNKIKLVTTSLIPTEIKVYFDEKEIPIHEDEVTIGRSTVEPHQDVVTLIKTGDVLHVKLPHFGIHLIDTGHDVHIKVSTVWAGLVCGLCGQYDGDSGSDDFIGPDQCEYPDPTSFGLSYFIRDPLTRCIPPPPPNPNKICNRSDRTYLTPGPKTMRSIMKPNSGKRSFYHDYK